MDDSSDKQTAQETVPVSEAGRKRPVTGLLAREFGELAAVCRKAGGDWWREVRAWFVFVHNRRTDTRFPIFPKPLRSAEILTVAASIILMLVLIADPFVLAAVNTPGWQPHPWFNTITEFGKSDWILYPAGLMLIVFSLWRRSTSRRGGFNRHSVMLAVYYMFTTVAFAGLIATLLKNIIGRARPPFVSEGRVWESIPFGDSYDFASFPSGHATTAGALAFALALLFPRLRVFFIVAGVWIAVSRPALGVHFPSDVVAGFAFGAAFSYYYARSFARKRLLFAFAKDGRLTLAVRQSRFVPDSLRQEGG